MLEFLLIDPKVMGIVQWTGLIFGIGSIWFAIWQISKVRNAAEAAAEGAKVLASAVFVRERLIELAEATGKVDLAVNNITRRDFPSAILCLEFSAKSCNRVRQLLSDEIENRKLQRIVVRLSGLIGKLTEANDARKEDVAMSLAVEAQKISRVMNEITSVLRYAYDHKGTTS